MKYRKKLTVALMVITAVFMPTTVMATEDVIPEQLGPGGQAIEHQETSEEAATPSEETAKTTNTKPDATTPSVVLDESPQTGDGINAIVAFGIGMVAGAIITMIVTVLMMDKRP